MFLRISKIAIFLMQIWCYNFYCCHGCVEEERTNLLLQIKDSINYPLGSSLDKDWVGKNCCKWNRIKCNPSSFRVISINLKTVREERLGIWHPNASLFAPFKELKALNLKENQIGGWIVPQAFSKMQSLMHINLDYNNFSTSIDSLQGLCELKNLRSLYLRNNNLDDRALSPCLSNLSMLEKLLLWGNDLGFYSRALTVVSRMQSLKILSLGSNNLSANIDSLEGICKLTALRSLDLAFNGLKDNGIPKCVGNLSLLEELYLWRNELTGSFSSLTGFCGLSSLRTLDLGSNNINDNDGSSLPKCLGNFSSLENLYLYDNNLTSFFGKSIPGLKQLQKLFLSSNHLTDDSISPWIYNLTSLTTLLLGDNRLSNSSTMRGFCKLRNLQVLDVSNNSFGGSIPTCFGNLNNLRVLYLPHNQFKGTIPSPIFKNLTMLTIISVSHNQFNGLIPFSMFANLSKLIYIDLSDNTQLKVETEYPHTVPTFQLQSLLLNNCILNKHSGGGMPTFISTQRRLETLDASYSFLRGTIPSWLLYNATVSSLNLRGNSLQGPFPQSTQHNKSMLGKLDISDNKIYGALPSNMGTLFPSLVLFNMSHNELHGTIPSSIRKLQMLTIMDLSENNLSGEMPHGLISNNTSLKYLKLSNNKLQGNILSKFSNMTELAVLLLDNNGFNGTIASDMLSSPSLKIIDLRKNNLLGHIPSWFPALTNLGILLLGGNFFNGPIPLELCLMQNLHILDLSNNAISGSIPSCLNNISSWMTETPNNIDWSLGSQSELPILDILKFPVDELYTRITTNLTTKGTTLTYGGLPLSLITGIDLSMNQLVGNIPSQVGHLKELHFLKLSNNNLSGPIPESFQNLKNIESLDLSHNKLVGTIPLQMIELYSLSTFNVSFNSLSGKIPYEKQFHTFDERSYMGNPDLCGPPLRRNCYNPSQPQDRKGEEEGSAILDSPIFFYLWVTMSYALGVWGFIALLANENRRRKIFRIVDCCFVSEPVPIIL